MPSLKHLARLLAQRVGVELSHYPFADPSWRVAQLLVRERVNVVLDVGANRGEYGRALRRHGYRGRIISFEPVAHVRRLLEQTAQSDPAWDVFGYALGASNQTVTINVAGNEAASSSILPMLDRHVRSAPASAYVGEERVEQRRLDDLRGELGLTADMRAFLKLDVQGYEHNVLAGAPAFLSEQLVGLQMELSFVPLYQDGMLFDEGFRWAEELGLTLMGVSPGFTDRDGQMLQADAVFFRSDGIGDPR